MPPRKHPPRLMLGPLTGRIYIATRYKDLGDGKWEAQEKYDVTSNFMAVKEEAERLFTYTQITSGSAAPKDSPGRVLP